MKDCLDKIDEAPIAPMTPGETRLLLELGLIRLSRETADGKVKEYALTERGREVAAAENRRLS